MHFFDFLQNLMDTLDRDDTRHQYKVLVMDNVRFHHVNEVKQLILSRGYGVEYLPPHSPELNPIENFWSSVKRKVRVQIASHNSLEGISDLVEDAVREIHPESIAKMINHCKHQFAKCELRQDIQ